MDLYIKNMVCRRCIMAVEHILHDLSIEYVHIRLGHVVISKDLNDKQKEELSACLKNIGFELLNDNQQQIVEQIKNIIIDQIYNKNNQSSIISDILSDKLNKDYSYLSKLFSSTEGITIEQYTILQKVERIKELLSYDQLSLTEIADRMGYSSVAHISAQFKKVTGITPSAFKTQNKCQRNSIDKI